MEKNAGLPTEKHKREITIKEYKTSIKEKGEEYFKDRINFKAEILKKYKNRIGLGTIAITPQIINSHGGIECIHSYINSDGDVFKYIKSKEITMINYQDVEKEAYNFINYELHNKEGVFDKELLEYTTFKKTPPEESTLDCEK